MNKLVVSKTFLCAGLLFICLGGCVQTDGEEKYEISANTPLISDQATQNEFSFFAPPEAVTMTVSLTEYQDKQWQASAASPIIISKDTLSSEQLSGTMTVSISQDFSVSLQINCCGTESSWVVSGAEATTTGPSKAYSFLDKRQTISLNEPIPLAVLVCGEHTAIESFTTDHYYSPEELGEWDLIQAILLTFET